MRAPSCCPQCGAAIRAAVLEGLCPGCVIRQSLDFARVVPIADSPVADRLRLPPFRTPIPQRVADYALESEIARGGMGVVYRARQLSLNRPVALKLLLSGQFADADQVRRFRAEAEAVARLDHPAIVPVYEVGEFEGRHFFSMKLIEGRSLAAAMGDFGLGATRRRAERAGQSVGPALRVRQRELAQFLANIARAVQYAHQRGLLHRDLKPANVLLDATDQPHVTDFGLARFVGDERHLTRTGGVFGTPAYMPPEQTEDPHKVTVAADVYSLGAIGYELMTGQPPFEAGNPVETVIQLREQEPTAPRALEPLIGKDLETLLLKCLAKDPAARYVSALALAEDLERFQAGDPVEARPVRLPERVGRWARRHPAVAALSATVAALVLGVAVVAPVVALRFSGEYNRAEEAGRRAARELREVRLARARAERLSGEAGQREGALQAVAEAARLQPDIALLDEAIAQLARFDAAGGHPEQPRAGPRLPVAMAPDFSVGYLAQPDGSVRAFNPTNNAPLWLWPGARTNRIGDLIPASDGRHLAIARPGWLEVVRLSPLELAAQLPIVDFICFSADGSWFLVLDPQRKVQRHETATGRLLGTLPLAATWPGDVAVSPDPRLPWLAVLAGTRVELFDWQENQVADVFEHTAPLVDIAWSGEWLAAGDDAGGIRTWHLPTRRSQLLNGHRTAIGALHFIPGTALLLSTAQDGQTYCWDAVSGNRIFTSNRYLPLQVSQDGRRLLYGTSATWGWTELQRPRSRVRLACLDGSDDNVRGVRFREDGRWLLVVKQAGVHLVDRVRGVRTDYQPALGTVLAAFVPGANQIVLQRRDELRWHSFDPQLGRFDPQPLRRYRPPGQPWLDQGTLAPDGTTLILPMLGGALEFVRISDGSVLRREVRPELAPAIWLDAHGNDVVFWLGKNKYAQRLNLGQPGPAVDLAGTEAVPLFSPDGRWLLLGGQARQQVLRVHDWKEIAGEPVSGRLSGIIAPGAWTADARFLALVVDRQQIVLRGTHDWQPFARLTTPQATAFSTLSFSPGGRWLAAGTDQGVVELWDLAELGREVRPLGFDFDWTVSPAEEASPNTASGAATEVTLKGVLGPQKPRGFLPRPPEATEDQLDLTAFYNAFLDANWNGPARRQNHLGELPPGLLNADGVVFDVRGVLQLNGERLRQARPDFPMAVTNIPVGRAIRRIHLLGAVSNGLPSVTRPKEVARLRWRYADGASEEVPIRLGEEIEDWWSRVRSPLTPKRSPIGWRGVSSTSELSASWMQLAHITLDNPNPGVVVVALDLISARAMPAPFFVAITLE